jgi:hypothetical protein
MKGTITISGDELLKMKTRANILPNGISSLTQPIQRKIVPAINFRQAKNAQISGQTTPSISNSERRKNASKSSKRNNSNADAWMKRKDNFNRNLKKKN